MGQAVVGVHDPHPAAAQEARKAKSLGQHEPDVGQTAALEGPLVQRRLERDSGGSKQLGHLAFGAMQDHERPIARRVEMLHELRGRQMTAADLVADEREADERRAVGLADRVPGAVRPGAAAERRHTARSPRRPSPNVPVRSETVVLAAAWLWTRRSSPMLVPNRTVAPIPVVMAGRIWQLPSASASRPRQVWGVPEMRFSWNRSRRRRSLPKGRWQMRAEVVGVEPIGSRPASRDLGLDTPTQ